MQIAEVLLATSRLPLATAAFTFAKSDIPIFPCANGGKRPLTHAGFRDASVDLDLIERWWSRWPGANIGMPTGAASGIDVLDVDISDAGSGFAAFERAAIAGFVEGELVRVRTPSNGMHVYFPAVASRPQRCWQVASAHIDFRANGGYVVVPPSAVATDHGRVSYRLHSVSAASSQPVDAVALRNFIDPRPAAREQAGGKPIPIEPVRLAQWVGRLREGERNRGLFWAACRLSEAGFAPPTVESILAPAARAAGLPAREISAVINSAGRQTGTPSPRMAEPSLADREHPDKRSGETPCL